MHLYYNIYMIQIEVPGRAPLEIRNLVCDVNGTLALDGILIEGVQEIHSPIEGQPGHIFAYS